MSKIYVIHENSVWVEPLRLAFEHFKFPFEEWHLDRGRVDLDRAPPEGVFYNRISASSHTRDHRFAPELTSAVLAWLESHGRRVFNDSRGLRLEVNKAAQYAALKSHGIRTPHTVAAVGRDDLIAAARTFEGPFIVKPNRGGKGAGVSLFNNVGALLEHLDGGNFEDPIDGITLVQDYIPSPTSTIVRAEFVGGRFLYAVEVDTSRGFELCPADQCDAGAGQCPATQPPSARFKVLEGFQHANIAPYERFLEANGIQMAGIEFITDHRGVAYTYDVNTNTNYNPAAEAEAGVSGMKAIAVFLGEELERESRTLVAAMV